MSENMLIQAVKDGKFTEKTATKTTGEQKETKGTTDLGKDSFLQLLVAEMQNQDPLEPSSNTEWISQLATFSQLQELQGLTDTTENNQIFSLIGKQVVITTESASGSKINKSGVVDFVTYTGGKAKFSVDGSLYDMTNLYSIVDPEYAYSKNAPKLKDTDKVEFTFNGDEPEDLTFEVDFGSEEAKASNVAILAGQVVLSSDYVTVFDGKVTVSKDILNEFSVGTYSLDLVFDDTNYTTIKGGIELTAYNTHPTATAGDGENGNEGA